MAELDLAPPVAAPEGARAHPRRVAAAVAAAAGIAAVLLVAGLVWTLRVPPELWPAPTYGGSDRLPVGHTLYVDTAISVRDDSGTGPQSYRLRIDSLVPRITENSAKAAVSILVCTRNGGTLGVGAQENGLDASCTSVLPFTGQQEIDLGFMTQQILLAVTPTASGTLHIEGLDVTYAAGGRAVTQVSGADLTLTATR
jgi:hypothetical protein